LTQQVLSEEQIKTLLKDPEQKSYRARWPSVEDKKLILEAMENKKESVKLSTGVFTLRYSDGIPYKVSNNGNHSTVFVRPSKNDELSPCGWFSPRELKRELEGDIK